MAIASFAPDALQARAPHLALARNAWERLSLWLQTLHEMSAHTNLIGTRDPDRMVDELLLDSLEALPLLPASGHILDVGSGAGVPGMPLQLARPDLAFTLIEPRRRRAAFLRHCRRHFALETLTVVEARLEDWMAERTPAAMPDLALARAVFSPEAWLDAATFLPEGRRILVFANGRAADTWAALQHRAGDWRLDGELDPPQRAGEPRCLLRLERRARTA